MTTTTQASLTDPAGEGLVRAHAGLLPTLLLALLAAAPAVLASAPRPGDQEPPAVSAGVAADGAGPPAWWEAPAVAPAQPASAAPAAPGPGPIDEERPRADPPAAPDPPVVAHAGGRTRSRSLVIVLHGGSWTGATPEELARRAVGDLHDEARRARLRLLAPEGPEVEGGRVPWLTDEGRRRVLALVDRELAAGRCAADRVTLAGHGAGATGALHLAASHPERFAAVAVWSGTPPPLWDAERRVVGLAPDPVPGLAGVPVYLWTGDDDPVLDRAALEHFVSAMAAAGSRHALTWEHGPGGHDLGPRGPRAGLRFLARHRKRQRP